MPKKLIEDCDVQEYVWYQDLGMQDVNRVGGKNASLGNDQQLILAGAEVPGGFATTAKLIISFGAKWS